MSIDLKALTDLIKSRPEIRTVEIADIIDCDPELIEPALRPHIAAGDIQVLPVIAPNGRTVNGFIWRKPEAAQSQIEVPVFAAQTSPPAGTSKIDLAIRFIRSNGSATSAELRRVMDLGPGQTPIAYLGGALKDGRLRKHGVNYYLGDQKVDGAAAEPEPKPSKARRPAGRRSQFPPASAAAIPPQPPAFRCGSWSDGVLELQRDGQTLVLLTADEQQLLARELNKKYNQPAV